MDGANPTADGIEQLPPEEEERVLALMDDGVQASIATMFMGREQNDVISVDHLTEIMGELQVAYDPEALARMVPESHHERLTLQDTKVLIGRFVDMAQRNSAEQAKAENAVTVTQSATTVQYLDTLAYLAHLLPCSNAEEGVTYRWNRPKIDIRPKTALMVSVAMMMLIVTVVLVVVVVVLSNDLISRQAHTSSGQLAAATDAVFKRLTDVGARGVMAGALQDAAASFSTMLDGMLASHEYLVFQGLSATAARFATSLQQQVDVATRANIGLLTTRVNATAAILARVGTLASLEALLTTWERRDGVLAVAGSGSTVHHEPVSYLVTNGLTTQCSEGAFANAACLSGTSTAMRSGSMTVCNITFHYEALYIPRLGVSVCAVLPVRMLHEGIAESVADFVTRVNEGLDGRYELEVAIQYANGQEPVPLGARRHLAASCARVGTCPDIVTGPYLTALALPRAGEVATAKMPSYQAGEWMTAFTRLELADGAQLAMLYTADYGPVYDSFKQAVGQGLLSTGRNATADAHIVLAVFDRLRRVSLLASDPTPLDAERQYLTYALNQRSGYVVPASGSSDEFLAGYTHAPSSNIGVGVQLSNMGLGVATLGYFSQVADTANQQFPEGWEISVYRVDSDESLILQTQHRKPSPCQMGEECAVHEAANIALARRTTDFVEADDYSGEKVLAWFSFEAGPPGMIVVAEISKEKWIDERRRQQLIEAVIVGAVALATVQVVIFVLTQRIMDRIEMDYTRYKHRIEEEKAQFSDLVKDVMPPYIAERIMKGTRLIAETHPQLTFFFSDIVGSTETSKTLTNKQLVRMLGYTFMLEDDVAAHFNIHKIKTIGDAYFAVSGLEDGSGSHQTGNNHQVYRMVSFACVTQQLIGPGFTHFPERTECFRVSAGGQDLGPMRMVRMRMGIHTGTAVAGVVDVGRAPHFDCFGPSVNLASRMESTSTAGRVQVSGPTAEILSKLDGDHLFEFDAPRRTLVKGYGTMTTFLVRSTNISIPKSILDKMGIEHSNQRQFFTNDGVTADGAPGGPGMPTGDGAAATAGATAGPATETTPGKGDEAASAHSKTSEQTPSKTAVVDDPVARPSTKDKSDKKDKRDKHSKKEKSDKKEKHSKKEKKDKKDHRSVSPARDEAPTTTTATKTERTEPSAPAEPAMPPMMGGDDAPPGVPDFDMGVPEPPPAFDPSGFDLPPPPPPDM